MKASDKCLDMIRNAEGFSATPYKCPAGIWTIGFGSTRYPGGARVEPSDPAITVDQANDMLRATLATEYEPAVNRYVDVPLTQGQVDALVDFAYNCGVQNLRTSTLLKKLNAGDYNGAADEFKKWVHSGGVVLPGLVKRRTHEEALFRGQA